MDRTLKLRMIFSATEQAAKPMQQVKIGAAAMGKELKEARDELKQLDRAQANVDSFRKLKRDLVDTGRELEQAQERTSKLATALKSTENPTREMRREFEAARRDADRLGDSFEANERQVEDLRRELKSAGISTNDLASAQKRLKTDMSAATREVEQQEDRLAALKRQEDRMADGRARIGKAQEAGSNLMGAGATAIGAGVAVGAPLVLATNEAMGLQGHLIDVRKVIDGMSPAGLKRLENGLIGISERVPIALDGLGEIAAEGARAGIPEGDLLAFVENSAKMAAAFDMEASDAGKTMAQWRKGLGLSIPETVLLGDKVNALTNAFGGAAPEIAEMVTLVGPLGKVAGVASGPMASMAQLMNSLGIDARVGATGIKNFMLTLSSGEGASDKQAAAFRTLGLEAEDMAKKMQVDAQGAILDVLDALAKLPKERQAGVLTNLFGRESVAAIAPMLSSLDDLKANFALIGDEQQYAGSMAKEFGVAMDKSRNKVAQAKGAIAGMAVSFGSQLIPVIDWGAAKIQTITSSIGGWAREHPGLAKGIAIGTAALAGLLLVVGGLAIAIGALLGPFALLRYAVMFAGPLLKGSMAVKVLVGAFKLLSLAITGIGRAMLMNPIGLFVTGIALAAYLIYSNWERVGPFFKSLWEGVKAVFAGVFTVLKAIVLTFTPVGLIYHFWEPITAFFAAIWSGVQSAIGIALGVIGKLLLNFTPAGLIYKHWDAIAAVFGKLWQGVASVTKSAWSGIATFFSGLWTGIKSVFTTVWSAIKMAATGQFNPTVLLINHWSKIAGWFGSLWSRVKNVFSERWSSIRAMMAIWPSAMWNTGKSIIDRLAAGIRAAPGAVWNALKDVVWAGINRATSWIGLGPKVNAGGRGGTAGKKLAGARAAGGPVGMGQMYLVGEKGPELFVPGSSGQILSNAMSSRFAKLGGGMALGSMMALAPAQAAQPAGDRIVIESIVVQGAGSPRDIAAEIEAAVTRILKKRDQERAALLRSQYRDT